MKIDFLIMGEGVVQDASGGFSMVRIGADILQPASLPASTKRSVLLGLREEEDSPILVGTSSRIELRVTAPSGKIVAVATNTFVIGNKAFSEVPGTALIPADFQILVEETGRYVIRAELSQPDTEVETAERYVHVVPPKPS
jgi:hypothetical protein